MSKEKQNNKINKYLKSAKKELDDFFGIWVDVPEICFINSRKHYDEMMGWKTKEYMVGHAKNGKIYILHPDIYVQESSHKSIDSFWKILKHEYCHIYYRTITKIGYPKWLNEGLATYLANQEKQEPKEKDKFKIFEYFQKNDWQTGIVGYYWVKLLIDKFGKNKLLELLKSLHLDITEKEFTENFKNIYGVEFSEKGLRKIYISKTVRKLF